MLIYPHKLHYIIFKAENKSFKFPKYTSSIQQLRKYHHDSKFLRKVNIFEIPRSNGINIAFSRRYCCGDIFLEIYLLAFATIVITHGYVSKFRCKKLICGHQNQNAMSFEASELLLFIQIFKPEKMNARLQKLKRRKRFINQSY